MYSIKILLFKSFIIKISNFIGCIHSIYQGNLNYEKDNNYFLVFELMIDVPYIILEWRE